MQVQVTTLQRTVRSRIMEQLSSAPQGHTGQLQSMKTDFSDQFQEYNESIRVIQNEKQGMLEELKQLHEELEAEEEMNISLLKKSGETENEIHTLKELSSNDQKLKRALKEQSESYKRTFMKENEQLNRELSTEESKLVNMEREVNTMKQDQDSHQRKLARIQAESGSDHGDNSSVKSKVRDLVNTHKDRFNA